MNHKAVIIAISCAALSVMLGTGIRSSFGLFLEPISTTLGTGRETFSLAMAINNLIYGLPLVGFLADRIGSRQVLIAGGVLYAVGLIYMSMVTTALGLHAAVGLTIGLALSATTYVVVLGAVAQVVPAEERTRSFGLITAGGSSGMLSMPLIIGVLLGYFDWQTVLVMLAVLSLLIILLAFGLPGRPKRQPQQSSEIVSDEINLDEPLARVLSRAARNPSYLLLTTGFFVCGFHVAFIGTHLPAFLADNGLSTWVASSALALIGGFNILGSFLFGWLGDLYRKKHLLSIIYFGRSVVIVLFLLFPVTEFSALAFGAAIGFLWLATVPLTSGTVAQIFGIRYMSTLYGMVFLSHQVGAFLGVWLGGRLYDTTGTYDIVWYLSIALGVVAALVHFPIVEKRPQVAQSATA